VAIALWATDVDPLSTTGDTSHAGLYVLILSAGQLISAAVLAPVTAAIDVLLYTDLRVRKEGMDIALRLGTPPAPGTVATAVSAW
jgi:hypothetical protein